MAKILHIYQSASFSGAEAYALEVACHHAKSNDVTFLAKKSSQLDARAGSIGGRLKVANLISDLELVDFDLIVMHSTQEQKRLWPKMAWTKIKARLGGSRLPKVVMYTHIWISHSKNDPLHAVSYACLDRVWCSSLRSKQELEHFLPVDARKIEVVHYGRDIGKLSSNLLSKSDARAKLDIPDSATVVGTIARVDAGKGSRELFEAVTDLMQSRADLHLLMIGPPTDGDPKAAELDAELNATIGKLSPNLRARVHKVGRLENGTCYLSVFDLFILATYKENFALTLLEALAARLPCLATESGGSPDVVRPFSTGWLFQPGSTDSLRTTLLTALEERAKWSEFGANGCKLVTENFDFQIVMRELDDKIEKLLAE